MHATRFFGLILLTVLMVIASGCKKDKDEPDPTPPNNPGGGNAPAGTMSATIGASSFSADNAMARYRTNGQLTIRATDDEEKAFFFVINNFSGTMTYAMNPGSQNSAAYEYNFGGQNIHFATTNNGVGELTITEYNESEQLLSGSFSFTAGQTGSPENIIEITEGEFNNVPIITLQQPAAGQGTFYFNDQFYHADSIEAFLEPLFSLRVRLYNEATGWIDSRRKFHTYPGPAQFSVGTVFSTGFPSGSGTIQAGFNSEYNSENQSISQTLKLETQLETIYDLEYKISEVTVLKSYASESQTAILTLWPDGPNPDVRTNTDAYLSLDSNGNYELFAYTDAGQLDFEVNVLMGPPLGIQTAVVKVYSSVGSNQFLGICSWQPSELGDDFYSFELLGDQVIVVAHDIPIVE